MPVVITAGQRLKTGMGLDKNFLLYEADGPTGFTIHEEFAIKDIRRSRKIGSWKADSGCSFPQPNFILRRSGNIRE